MAVAKWRTRRLGAVLFAIFIQVVNGYEETYTISQLSPRSVSNDQLPEDTVFQTSRTGSLAFSIEPSVLAEEEPIIEDIIKEEEKDDKHYIVARSADPIVRDSRSINIDEIPSSNNEIDNELEIHNKRKYYEIHPTKTIDYLHSNDEVILSSEGFGDRLEFRFPGEGKRVPYGRALAPAGPRIKPTVVQPIFATASLRNEGRQNSEIQNIITGIVKLLNGNVNVQANTQLLRPGRPLASRINNRGPPRISDVPPLLDFEKPMSAPHGLHPTKTPPPYPFERPPVHVNLPEQIVPPLPPRPAIHRPMPPWQRPRPRPPNRRPNPGLPMYKPNFPILPDFPDVSEEESPEEVTVNENETVHSENTIHREDEVVPIPEVSTVEDEDIDTKETTTEKTTTSTTTTTTEATTTESTTTTTSTTTEKTTTSTTEKPKTDKPVKPEKDKKKETPVIEKDKGKDKYKTDEKTPQKVSEDKILPSSTTKVSQTTKTPELNVITEVKPPEIKEPPIIKQLEEKIDENIANNNTAVEVIQSSISEPKPILSSDIVSPTPTEGLVSHAPTVVESSSIPIETSSINTQPLPTSQGIPYHPYRPRPGIVLDDPDFKPHGSRRRPEASVITALPDAHLPGYGEIFDVTVSAIQGPGEKGGGSVHIENINVGGPSEDDIIVSASGQQGFVSIDGKRTYLNLFDTSTAATSVRPTRVQTLPQNSVPPLAPSSAPTIGQGVGQGVAIPTDDVPVPPVRRPAQHPLHRPQQGYRRPQPTVRIDTCIVGDDSTCDQAQNEKCRTELGISSCQCRPGYARRIHRDPCRRVVALLLDLRVDRLYDRKVAWDPKLSDKESDPYQQLSYEAVRAIDSAFSMTPFSDDFVGGSVNMVHRGDENNQGVFVNYTILMQETGETLRSSIATEIQKHILGVIRRRSNNVGASALWVDSVAGSVLPLHDVDECASSDLNDCHQLATCTNTWGGFRCTCPDTTLDPHVNEVRAGRECRACAATHCSERGQCRYSHGQPTCSCTSGYYGSRCEVDGEVVGVAVGASLAAALVIALTLAALMSWSRKWSREAKAAGMGSPVFSYMAANTVKTPPVGQPPYQVTMEERLRWAQIAEAMVQANHYASEAQTMQTRPSSAMFGGYPTLPPVPLPRMGMLGHHNGTLNTVASRINTAASHHNLYGYTNHMATESTSSEASSHVQERADLLVPRPKSRARSMHNQTGIYYDVDYENTPEPIYGSKGIPLSTYTVSRGPPFYRS